MPDDTLAYDSGADVPEVTPGVRPKDGDVLIFGGGVRAPSTVDFSRNLDPSTMPHYAPTMGDVGRAALAGWHRGVAAPMAALTGAIAAAPNVRAQALTTVGEEERAGQAAIESMTPGGQAARTEPWYSHPLMTAAEQGPGFAALAIPATVGTMVGGPAGGIAASGLAMGAQTAGGSVEQFVSDVRASNLPEDEKQRIIEREAPGLAAKTSAIGFAAGAIPGGLEARGLGLGQATKKIFGSGLVNRVLAGGVESGITFGAAGAAQAGIIGETGYQAGVRGPPTAGEMGAEALSQGEMGLGFGMFGGLWPRAPREEKEEHEPTQEPAQAPTGDPLTRKLWNLANDPNASPNERAIALQKAKERTLPATAERAAPAGAPGYVGRPAGDFAQAGGAAETAAETGGRPGGDGAGVGVQEGAVSTPSKKVRAPGTLPESGVSGSPVSPGKGATKTKGAPSEKVPAAATDTGPDPAPPKVDVAQEAALKPGVTPGVTPDQTRTIQPGVAPDSRLQQVREDMARRAQELAGAPSAEPARGVAPTSAEPTPEPPRPVPEPHSPELVQQHAELLDPKHPRNAVLYPPGQETIKPAERASRYPSVQLENGQFLQVDRHRAPWGGRKDEVIKGLARDYERQGRLSELTSVPEPRPPDVTPRVRISEETPAGPPRTAADDPELARLRAEMTAQLQEQHGARVLPDVSDEGVRRAAEQREAEADRFARAQAEAAAAEQRRAAAEAEVEEKGRKGKAAEEKLARDNPLADAIMAKYPRVPGEARDETRARARNMLREAKEQKIDIPDQVGGQHSPGMHLLSEAKAMGAAPKSKAIEDFLAQEGRFLSREGMLAAGEGKEALKARRAEGRKALGLPEKAEEVAAAETPESKLIEREEKEEPAREEPAEAVQAIERRALHAATPEEHRFARMTNAEVLKLSPAERERYNEWYGRFREARIKELRAEKAREQLEPSKESEETFTPRSEEAQVVGYQRKERPPEVITRRPGETFGDFQKRKQAAKVKEGEGEKGTRLKSERGPTDEELRRIEQEERERELLRGIGWEFSPHEEELERLQEIYYGFRRAETPEEKELNRTGEIKARIEELRERIEIGEEKWARKQQPGAVKIDNDYFVPTRVMDGRAAIQHYTQVNKYMHDLRPMVRHLMSMVIDRAGKTPVYVLSDADMERVGEPHAWGFYDWDKRHIVLRQNMPHDTPLHEVFHAATHDAIEHGPPEIMDHIEKIMDEVEKQLPNFRKFWDVKPGEEQFYQGRGEASRVRYAMSNVHEFITVLMTNPEAQRALKRVKISPMLAQELGLPKWRKATGWNGVLHTILRAFGVGPKYASAIEAVMSVAERAITERIPGVPESEIGPGMRMEQAARMGEPGRSDVGGTRLYSRMVNPQELPDGEEVGRRFERFNADAAREITSAARTNITHWWSKARQGFLSGTQIAGLHRGLFQDKRGSILDDINHALEKRWQEQGRLSEADRAFIARSYQIVKDNSASMHDFGRLLDMSGKYSIHADEPEPPKEQERSVAHQAALDNWQANHYWREAHELYKKLPSELQSYYKELKGWYKGKAQALASEHIERTIRAFAPPEGSTKDQVVHRALNRELTDEDREHYKMLGVADEISKAYGFMNPKGVYFNAFRDGDHVVTGRYDMPAGGNSKSYDGKNLNDSTREFDTREQAHEFATDTELHATTRIAHYMENTKTHKIEQVLAGEAIKDPDWKPVQKYQVTLQREHTEMHPTAARAEQARKTMIEAGVKNVSQVLDKRNNDNWARINGATAQAFENRIRDNDTLSRTEKQALIEASRNMALTLQSGNRLNRHWVTRRNIAGANYSEVADAVRSYSRAANYHIANSRALPDIDSAMERLKAHEEANREHPQASLMSSITNTMRDRTYAGVDSLSPKTPGWLRTLMTLSFAKYLLTPRFIIQHQLHPIAFTAPQMAGRHGYMHSLGYIRQALSDVGGNIPNIGKGMKASYSLARAAITGEFEDYAPLNMTDDVIGRISKLNAREGAALQSLKDTGHLHSGFDDEVWGSNGLDKVNAFMRQTTNAMEATNRTSAGLASYRAEFDKLTREGKSEREANEKAITYARQTIENSMGVFSPTNIAPMFRHPYLRGALQFKQFPLQLTYSLVRNAYRAFKDESPEVRKEAVRALGYQLGSAAVMSGVSGMPLEALKAVGLLGYALGVTPAPSQVNDRVQRALADNLTPGVANAVMNGALSALGPWAPNVSNIFGYNADFFYNEPHSQNDWKSYMWDTLVGAPGNAVTDAWQGMHDAANGDWSKAIGHLSPIGAVSNVARAFTLADTGLQTKQGLQVMPASYPAAAMKILGFTTQQQQRAYEGRTALEKDIADVKAEKSSALERVRHGDMGAVYKWNAANPQDKISPQQAQQARRGQSAASILGIKITKQNRARLEEFQRAYQ